MRAIISVVLVGALMLVGCGSESGEGDGGDNDAGNGAAEAAFAEAQAVIDRVADRHAQLARLTLHAIPEGESTMTQLASTMPERRGKPSDPEDFQAMESGEEVVLEEDGAIDVTVPLLMEDGEPTAVAGVTLEMEEGADREALIAKARSIAAELEREIKAAGKKLW